MRITLDDLRRIPVSARDPADVDGVVALPGIDHEVPRLHHVPETKQLTGGIGNPVIGFLWKADAQVLLEFLALIAEIGDVTRVDPADCDGPFFHQGLAPGVVQSPHRLRLHGYDENDATGLGRSRSVFY